MIKQSGTYPLKHFAKSTALERRCCTPVPNLPDTSGILGVTATLSATSACQWPCLRVVQLTVDVEVEGGDRQGHAWSMDNLPAKRAAASPMARQPPHDAPLVEPVPALEAGDPLVGLHVLHADGARIHRDVAGSDRAIQDERGCLEGPVCDVAL